MGAKRPGLCPSRHHRVGWRLLRCVQAKWETRPGNRENQRTGSGIPYQARTSSFPQNTGLQIGRQSSGLSAPHCVRGYVHQVFDKNSDALRWVHALISNLKSFLLGIYHGLSNKHLQSYFDEFSFYFNCRFWPEPPFPGLVCALTASSILGYDDLTR